MEGKLVHTEGKSGSSTGEQQCFCCVIHLSSHSEGELPAHVSVMN